MSGKYPELLKKRALNALKWANKAYTDGDYDIAVREAEYGVRLYIKSVIHRVLGEEVRGHNIRELLGVLTSALLEEGLRDEAELLLDYVRKHRRELAELSDAHTRATYGLTEYGRNEAKLLLEIAENIVDMLKKLEAKVFGGEV